MRLNPYRIAVASWLGLLFLGAIDARADPISFDRGNVVVRTDGTTGINLRLAESGIVFDHSLRDRNLSVTGPFGGVIAIGDLPKSTHSAHPADQKVGGDDRRHRSEGP